MRIIAIAGEPATGKSALVGSILYHMPPSHGFTYGRLKGHCVPKLNLWVLGNYDVMRSDTFGTDFLGINIAGDAMRFLIQVKNKPLGHGQPKPTILFEGRRLVNYTYLRHCLNVTRDFSLLILVATNAVIEERMEADHRAIPPAHREMCRQEVENLRINFTGTDNGVVNCVNQDFADQGRLRNLLIAKINKFHD